MVEMHDLLWLRLHKLAQAWNPDDKVSAINALQPSHQNNEILYRFIVYQPNSKDLHNMLNTIDVPLNTLDEKNIMPKHRYIRSAKCKF